MTVYRILGSKLALALAVLGLLGIAPQRLHAQVSTPQATSVLDVATAWIYALKRGDVRMLDRASVYPFELRLANPPCSCTEGRARDAAQLELLLGELMKSEDVKALDVTSRDVKEISKTLLPTWAKRWAKRLPKGARLVHIEGSGGAVAITYILLVTDDRVRAVWLTTAADGGK